MNYSSNNQAPRVLCIGSLNLDILFDVERLPRLHEKYGAKEVHYSGGGSAANTAFWLKLLGCDVTFMGRVGIDAFAAIASGDLLSSGVRLSLIETEDAPTGLACVFIYRKQKNMVTSPRKSDMRVLFDRAMSRIGEFDHIHIATRDTERARRFIGDIGSHCVPGAHRPTVSVEMNGRFDPHICDHAALSFINRDEVRRSLHQSRNLWSNISALEVQNWLIVTDGKRGAVAFRGAKVVKAPTSPVDPVDRTGAGDAFDAGVIASYLRGLDIDSSMRIGLRTASAVLKGWGARPQSEDTVAELAAVREMLRPKTNTSAAQ